MPSAALRPCASGCGARVQRGSCPSCSRRIQTRRGTAFQRGYTPAWQRFRVWFIAQLVELNIAPVCGTSLPGGPSSQHSVCRAQGIRNGERLHLDHEPPLREHERHDPHAVMNPQRIVLLCATCHNTKTAKEQVR